ncbi:MAG: structural protein P5 [Alistipes sp.]|jgi:hypothetical protein|nr:structural protein P5 [Alistipes sp.]MBO5856213.1 structural protein P5 [Alistipes sp.]
MSRGLRNCNPGNIRRSKVHYLGEVRPSQDSDFKQFESMAYGYRAMFVLLDSYRRRYALNTLRQMLNRYAPPSENFTEGYIRFVSQKTGILPDEELNTRSERDMVPIISAMSEIENGVSADRSMVLEGWRMFVNKN